MKLIQSLIVAAVVAAPVVSYAQSSQSLTRAQVRAELLQVEKAGYSAASVSPNYPQDILDAEARVSAQDHETSSAYGPSASGSSQAGSSSASKQNNFHGLGPVYDHS